MNDHPQISPEQAKVARALLGLGAMYVCRELGIAPQTLKRAEIARTKGGPLPAAMLSRLRRYYEAAGIEFTAGEPPGVGLKAGASSDAV
jgi:hypothetical protein